MKISEILQEAVEFLSQEGHWLQHEFDKIGLDGSITGACALGAINLFAPLGMYTTATQALSEVLPNEKLSRGIRIIDWNNDPERTLEDIVFAFKQAIYKCEEEGI